MTKTKKDENTGLITIERNGKTLICPFQPPTPVPGKIAGTMALLNHPCADHCPMFTDNENGTITLKCKDLTLWIDEKQPEKSKLLQI